MSIYPTDFSLLVFEVTDFVQEKGKHGMNLLPGLEKSFLLLFADDFVLFRPHQRVWQLEKVSDTGLNESVDFREMCTQLLLETRSYNGSKKINS